MAAHPTARARLEQAVVLFGLAGSALDLDWEQFKALAAATIVLARSTLHLIRTQDRSKSGFDEWWSQLESKYRTLKFFRDERDALLKARMVALHGLGYADTGVRFVLKAEGQELPPPPPPPPPIMTRQAFFDATGWDDKPALDYIAQYLTDLEAVLTSAESQF